MRDGSIDTKKENVQMSISSPALEVQESPFPRDIDRNTFARFTDFTPEAKAFLVERVRAFAEQLIQNSAANAEENGLDNISAKNVAIALHRHHLIPRSRFKKYAGIFGGVLLGAGISALVSMLMVRQVTEIGSILAFILSVLGAFLVALDN